MDKATHRWEPLLGRRSVGGKRWGNLCRRTAEGLQQQQQGNQFQGHKVVQGRH